MSGQATAPVVDPVVSVNIEGFLPDDYVPEINQRLALYKRLTGVTDDAGVADVRAELADRFGPLPDEAAQLCDIVRIRVAARAIGVEKVEAGEGKALITFSPSTTVSPDSIVRAIAGSKGRLRLKREFTLEATIERAPWSAERDSLLRLLRELGAK